MSNINNKNFKTKLLFAELSELNGQQKIELFRKIIELSESNQSNESNRKQKIELFRNIIDALIENKDIMNILNSSYFFVDEYLQQEFKQSSRFKFDKIHPNDGVPLKESHEKRLIKNKKKSVKFSSHNKKEELKLSSFVEQKPKLRYFTMGSKQHPKQFETWSPEEMYNWWLSLRTSGIPKSEWKILDAVFFLFINQISCICNSYIRYGIKNNKSNLSKEVQNLLKKYFNLLDEFYKSGGQYDLLINTHFAFCEWFEYRINDDSEYKMYIEYENESDNILDIFNKKKETKIVEKIRKKQIIKVNKNEYIRMSKKSDFSLILFTSYFHKPSKFISLYCIPVITIIGIPHKSHNGLFYTPFSQLGHEFLAHGECLEDYYNYIYSQKKLNDIELFKEKMIFLQLLLSKKNDDATLFLWYILHEQQNFDILPIPDNLKNILRNVQKNLNEKYSVFRKNFFEIKLFLEQLTGLRFIVNTIINSKKENNEKREALPRILDSIDVLIETCKETINIVKNEHYNNYMRNQRNPRNEF